jgi:hypothetical protein
MALLGLRSALMAERSQVLTELGLDLVDSGNTSVREHKKRGRHEEDTPTTIPSRRSLRVAGLPLLKENSYFPLPTNSAQISDVETTGTAPARIAAPPIAGSARSLPARIGYMTATYLGEHVPVYFGGDGNQAKRAVMYEANAFRSIPCPTFSIMSGLQEWSNAMFLFVVSSEATSKCRTLVYI